VSIANQGQDTAQAVVLRFEGFRVSLPNICRLHAALEQLWTITVMESIHHQQCQTLLPHLHRDPRIKVMIIDYGP
jgi:hypothetical protein